MSAAQHPISEQGAHPPVALTIAGSDSGGGAGIAADLKTFAAHGVFGTLALTAVTAQNTEAVSDVVVLETAFVDAQIDAVLADFPVAAAKTGMLASLEIVERLAERASAHELPPLVVDPVMVASSGALLFVGDTAAAYRHLLPHALIVTPNLLEAEALTKRSVTTVSEMADAARMLVDMGAAIALVKGGHLSGPDALDIVFDGTELIELRDDMVASRNVHGTGCTLSAAIAANLARDLAPVDAIVAAKRYLAAIIRASVSFGLGTGPGPLDHFSARGG